MVLWCSGSTKDSESFDPSSNLGTAFYFPSYAVLCIIFDADDRLPRDEFV